MKIAFRVDSSYRIGSGHLMRCLTLADSLRDHSVEVLFVCREHDGDMSHIARDRGYTVTLMPTAVADSHPDSKYLHSNWLGVSIDVDASHTFDRLKQKSPIDWLVVDHYAIDASWEEQMRSVAGKILVIDDLADRSHDCEILLDQNFEQSKDNRYTGLVGSDCRLLCGPKYALLRPQFLNSAYRHRKRDGSIKRVLVFFGGVDSTGETLKTCRAILSLKDQSISADILAGSSNPQHKQIEKFCSHSSQLKHHAYVDDIAALMSKADLAIGAGGTTTWERAWLGLPSIIIVVAENQMEVASAMGDCGAAWNIGLHSDVTESTLGDAICYAANNKGEVVAMSKAARSIFGTVGRPGVDLVVNSMLERQYART